LDPLRKRLDDFAVTNHTGNWKVVPWVVGMTPILAVANHFEEEDSKTPTKDKFSQAL
jgi:hypothetical protein